MIEFPKLDSEILFSKTKQKLSDVHSLFRGNSGLVSTKFQAFGKTRLFPSLCLLWYPRCLQQLWSKNLRNLNERSAVISLQPLSQKKICCFRLCLRKPVPLRVIAIRRLLNTTLVPPKAQIKIAKIRVIRILKGETLLSSRLLSRTGL